MLDFMIGFMATIGTISCLITCGIIIHCYFATKDVYKQIDKINNIRKDM